jgi:phosphomevalonate kinase
MTTIPASSSYTLASSPGKVLLAGGYLVLSPAYPGLVVGTDSRFYSLVAPFSQHNSGPSTSSSVLPITIRSPQFEQAIWTFSLDVTQATISLSKASAESPNAGRSPFLCISIIYCLALAFQQKTQDELKTSLGSGLDIHVLADNDFYSQRKEVSRVYKSTWHDQALPNTDIAFCDVLGQAMPPTSEYLRSLTPFNQLHCPISKVHKTGLGSSAALTTSLVSALLVHLGVVSRDLSDEDLALLHNAAQLAHCAAQGKVGSGFDVSSAVWGSQVFRRFDPLALEALLQEVPAIGVEGSEVSWQRGLDGIVRWGTMLSRSHSFLHRSAYKSPYHTRPTLSPGPSAYAMAAISLVSSGSFVGSDQVRWLSSNSL